MGKLVDPRKQIEAELKRLQAKRKEVNDRDLRSALDLAIQERQKQLADLGGPDPTSSTSDEVGRAVPGTEDEEVEEVPLPEPPTPAAREQAEKLIQQARLERRRNNTSRATDLLEEAVRVAPGASDVQELVGDELLERKRFKEALARFELARKLDPKNVSADKKHAELVFKTKASAATAGMSMMYERDQMVTNAKKGAIFSLFLPGSGQILLGENVFGGVILGLWSLMVFWVFLWQEDLYGVLYNLHLHTANSHTPTHAPNYAVLLPVLSALILHAISVFSAAAESASAPSLGKVSHPEPPVQLPFE